MSTTLDIGQPTGNMVVGPRANEITIGYAWRRFEKAIHMARDGSAWEGGTLTTNWWV